MKITYKFADPKDIVEVEVPEDIGEVVIRLDKDERNSYQKLHRRSCSLEAYDSYGRIIEADEDIERDYLENEEHLALHAAIATLLPQQRELIYLVFFENKSLTWIANKEGVSVAAIHDRLKKIYAQLRKKL